MEKNDPYIQIKVDDNSLREMIAGVQDAMKYQIKVGILANDTHETKDGEPIGMAELGAIHEFGSMSRGIPERSFIRRTMFQKQEQFIRGVGRNNQAIMKMIQSSGLKAQMEQWATLWKSWVLECFNSRGFGAWPALSQRTVDARFRRTGKNSDTPLQDTGRLIQSIASEVTTK